GLTKRRSQQMNLWARIPQRGVRRKQPIYLPSASEANMPNDNAKADVDISLADEADAADAAVISGGLRAHYVSKAGYYDFRPLAVFVRDPQTRRVIGGVHRRTGIGPV